MSINYFLQDVFLLLTLQVFFTCQIVLKGNENVFEHVENWPKYQNFGEISGVGTDNFDNVYVFHRGDRQWNNYTFSNSNLFLGKNNGPITSETIVIIDSNSGSLVTKTGNNL